MNESEIQRRIQLACSRGGARLWRNQVGAGWSGKSYQATRPEQVMLAPGDVVIRQGRMVKNGLGVGSPDLIGYQVVEITPSMVGSKVAVFVGVEVKAERGRLRPEQKQFLEHLTSRGALAGVARSASDVQAILSQTPAADR